jgi:chromosome partitioning protein
MPVVSFISQKGGVGKSTLARALAREAAAAGLAVKIADLDIEQGTAVDWARRRMVAGFEPVVAVQPFRTAADAFKVADQVDLLVIDGPARASAGTLAIAKGSALVVQPASTSIDDLRPAVLVFNTLVEKGVPRDRLALALVRTGTEAEEAFARDYIEGRYEILPGALPERPAYRQAQNDGQAVTEVRFKGLSGRADALIQAIIDRAGL